MFDQLDPCIATDELLPSETIHVEVRRRVPAIYTQPPFEDVFRREGDLYAWHDILKLAQPPTVPGLMSRLKAMFKIQLARALNWLFVRQVEFNSAVAMHACESARVSAALDSNVLELFTALTSLRREFDRLAERQQRCDARVAELEAELAALRPRSGRP